MSDERSMHHRLLPGLILLTSISTAAQMNLRPQYEQVVARKYPGFRILNASDFESYEQNDIRDGEIGSLVVGQFNFDKQLNFAALIIPAKTTRYDAGTIRTTIMPAS